jgi:hypothetical protein
MNAIQPELIDVPHANRGHHPYSPSTLQAREASPCYRPNSGGSNKASERGTAQHEAVESGSADGLSDEEAAAVAMAMDCLADAVRQLGGSDALVEREEYLPIDEERHRTEGGIWRGTTGGYADAVVISLAQKKAHVLDWKFGKHAVEPAQNNTQGIAYALGVRKRVRDLHGIELDEVKVSFISPHIEDRSDHTFSSVELDSAYNRILTIVVRAALATAVFDVEGFAGLKARGLLKPTTSACVFCARVAECPAVAETLLNVSKKYAPLEFPAEVNIRALDLRDPKQAQQILALSGVAGRWAKETRSRITEYALLDDTFRPEGYQLIVSYSRKVPDAKKLFDTAAKLIESSGLVPHGKTAEEVLWSFADVPLTPIEEFVSAAAPRGGKTAAVEEFSTALEQAGAVEKSTVPTVSLRMKSTKNNK